MKKLFKLRRKDRVRWISRTQEKLIFTLEDDSKIIYKKLNKLWFNEQGQICSWVKCASLDEVWQMLSRLGSPIDTYKLAPSKRKDLKQLK